MWIPARLIPHRFVSGSWNRHLAARFACSGMILSMLLVAPGVIAALGALTDSDCLFRSLIGLPCPGCGITTSLLALARGDWSMAVTANPAGLSIIALVIAQMAPGIRQLLRPAPGNFGSEFLRACDGVAIAMLCVVWGTRLVQAGIS